MKWWRTRGQLKSPFRQWEAICCWLTWCFLPFLQQDLVVICSSPASLVLNSVPGGLPLPVCSVIPLSQPRCNVSWERKLCEVLNGWHGWDRTADSKQATSLHSSWSEDATKINLFLQKASIFTQLHFSTRKKTLISSRSPAQLCLFAASSMLPLQGLMYISVVPSRDWTLSNFSVMPFLD